MDNKLLWSIDKLKNWDKNPRGIDKKDFERLKNQIKKLGQYKPLLITPDGTVLGGNMRLRAYQELGINEVWVSIVEPNNEAEMLEYALSDNDRAGYYNEDELSELVYKYKDDINLDDYAVDLGKFTNLSELDIFQNEIIEDEAPPLSDGEPVSKLGEIYQLGKHRLMCGDATKIEDVEKLMDGKKADMVFTDPPYGVDFKGAKYNPRAKSWDGIENDSEGGEKLRRLITDSLVNAVKFCGEASPVYVWSPPMQEGYEILKGIKQADIHIQSQLVWFKNTIVLGQADYQWKHEVCWYGWTQGKHHYWNGGRSLSTVWEYSKDANQSYVHPNQKPVKLGINAINNSCREDGAVLDLFGGSGSTLIACEQTNRICYMMEIDPKYCDVIRKRYAKLIGKEDIWQEIMPMIRL